MPLWENVMLGEKGPCGGESWMTTTFWVAMICVASLTFTTMKFPCQQTSESWVLLCLKQWVPFVSDFKIYIYLKFSIHFSFFFCTLYISEFFVVVVEIWKRKVSFSPLSVTLGITLTLVNLVQKGGFFGFPILFYSVPPDKKLIEISFATHHWPGELFFSFMNKSKGEEIIFY